MALQLHHVAQYIFCWWCRFCTWDKTLHFTRIHNLQTEGKETCILWKPKTLLIEEMRQWATKYWHCEINLYITVVLWIFYSWTSLKGPLPSTVLHFIILQQLNGLRVLGQSSILWPLISFIAEASLSISLLLPNCYFNIHWFITLTPFNNYFCWAPSPSRYC
jgi:hypothetical protein